MLSSAYTIPSTQLLRASLLLAMMVSCSLVSALDEESCEACIDLGCGYCKVDSVETCVCTQSDFDSGSACNGGRSSFKTNAKIGCTKKGAVLVIVIVLVIFVAIIAGSIVGGWYCCCRNKNPQPQQQQQQPATQMMTIPATPPVYQDSPGFAKTGTGV